MKLYENIKKLVQYGIDTGLTPECERIYTTNLLLDLMRENSYEDVACDLSDIVLEDVLHDLLDEACARGIIEDDITSRDLFDTKLMNALLPRPAQVQQTFREQYELSPEAATAYYYKFSQDSDYIRRYRIKKDQKWKVNTEYGSLDITINLSKPEKDPKAIAAAGKAAHLGGVLAAHTTLPVIGIPIKSSTLDGLDALLATVQMPSGIPVATVAINGAENAAILAVQMLALSDEKLAAQLDEMKDKMNHAVIEKDAKLQQELAE